ncbi:MAG: hypothetical protein JW731_00200 [Bacteroidales bacterium]|nr:hypothetical protein [Bacteroidales bacterium]
MNLKDLCKYLGLASGFVGALFILAGVIGFFVDNFLNVKNFSWFFYAANTFIFFAIFCILVSFNCKDKKE